MELPHKYGCSSIVEETTMHRSTRESSERSRILSCIVALLIIMTLAACGGDTPTATPTEPTATIQVAPTEQPAASATATTLQATATTTIQPTTAVASPVVTSTSEASADKTFTNPVLRRNFPDPFVLLDNGVYYAYATNGTGKNIQVATSPDLVTWKVLNDALPGLPSWVPPGDSRVWAPEVIRVNDKYVMYYTARDKTTNKQCVGVATADKPDAIFKDTNTTPFVCQTDQGGTIDANAFRDGDKLYLYYKNDGNCCSKPTRLWVQELAPDGLSLVGEPVQLVENDTPWEGSVVEAPTMWKHDDKYYLFFSANNYAGFEYAVGYATCESPLGPCQDAPENPILSSRMKSKPLVVGPGHQTLVQVGDQTWIIYHVWDVLPSGMVSTNRFVYMDKLNWQDGKPVVAGPSTDPEPVPDIADK
jgi:beta-xylosidase